MDNFPVEVLKKEFKFVVRGSPEMACQSMSNVLDKSLVLVLFCFTNLLTTCSNLCTQANVGKLL